MQWPAGEDGDQELIDDLVLAHDLSGHLLADLAVGLAQLFQLGEVDVVGRLSFKMASSPASAGKPEGTCREAAG